MVCPSRTSVSYGFRASLTYRSQLMYGQTQAEHCVLPKFRSYSGAVAGSRKAGTSGISGYLALAYASCHVITGIGEVTCG